MTARQQFDAVFQTFFTQRGIKNILTKLNTPDRLREAESAVNRLEAALSALPAGTAERTFAERMLSLDRERLEKLRWDEKRLEAAQGYVQWVEDGLAALTDDERLLIDLRHLAIGKTGPLQMATGAIGERVGKTAHQVDAMFAGAYAKMTQRMGEEMVRAVYIYDLKRRVSWFGCKSAKAKLERLTRESGSLCSER